MKILSKLRPVSLLGALLVMFTLWLPTPAQAAFVGTYDPSNFTLTNTDADGFWVLNPDGSLTLTGGNDGSGNPGSTTFLILAAASGLWTFDWSYSTLDFAGFDRGGYSINSVFTLLGDFDGASGSISLSLNAGDLFGFRMETDDNTGEPGVLTISNFEAPGGGGAPIPEPSSWLLGVAGLAALGALERLRRTPS